MKYTVQPLASADCDCDDCRAGRHLYELLRWQEGEWHWVATSLKGYASAADCKANHYWVLDFEPGAVWDDGSPIVPPVPACKAESAHSTGGLVRLNTQALTKSFESLARHWPSPRSTEAAEEENPQA